MRRPEVSRPMMYWESRGDTRLECSAGVSDPDARQDAAHQIIIGNCAKARFYTEAISAAARALRPSSSRSTILSRIP